MLDLKSPSDLELDLGLERPLAPESLDLSLGGVALGEARFRPGWPILGDSSSTSELELELQLQFLSFLSLLLTLLLDLRSRGILSFLGRRFFFLLLWWWVYRTLQGLGGE